MLTILDVNNFWSPKGGGVRRYHLEKLAFMAERDDVRYVFVQPDHGTWTEARGRNLIIEHVRAPHQPMTRDYRMLVEPRVLRELVQLQRPSVIECGSPAVLPALVHLASLRLDPRPALVGFWHADFPRTYVARKLGEVDPRLAEPGERAAWWWARRGYGSLDAVFVASRRVARNLLTHGLDRLYYTPLGVDCRQFEPSRRDPELVARFKAGRDDRLVICFAHRFQNEKGLDWLMRAYAELCRRLPVDPALVFAGTGPDVARVQAMAARRAHVHYVGYLDTPEAMARLYASCDLALALSAFETFGLSCAEAMASGLAIVAADRGGAAELVEDADCGLTVRYGDVAGLVDALERLATGERDSLAERGARARRHVEPLTWTRCFERELACYAELVAAKRAGRRIPPGVHERLMPGALARGGRLD